MCSNPIPPETKHKLWVMGAHASRGSESGDSIALKHDEISMEPYSGCPFRHQELVPSDKRFACVRFNTLSMGVDFNWTVNQEMLFSFALTGKPARKEAFGEYFWNYCVVGTREDYVMASAHEEWSIALEHGSLWDLKIMCDDNSILAPASNTDYACGNALEHILRMQRCHVRLELATSRYAGMATSETGLGNV